ncbi:hypothetical protein AK812_SmicGene16123 [Symbiodinium microadriaticum]|uniref:protein-serine/threonine phosphatase n=1 Tax=Symbiodinium microadriaticum TaxID=2951 RepID=A0A1Q9E166_SYMMI|nr:hypothetical protein AK812_SmicGene16123 [Symbiodinium microadriaticum]
MIAKLRSTGRTFLGIVASCQTRARRRTLVCRIRHCMEFSTATDKPVGDADVGPDCQGSLIAGPDEALRVAFAQEGLLLEPQCALLFSQQDFDTETSGTTATVALVPPATLPILEMSVLHFPEADDESELQGESWLYVANVGDSRAVNRLTRDHRPDDLAEAERIAAEGGEVRRLRPGAGTSRIFAPGGVLYREKTLGTNPAESRTFSGSYNDTVDDITAIAVCGTDSGDGSYDWYPSNH